MSDEARRYRIVRPLGSGGAAEVFEALLIGAEGFERRVALKRPLPDVDLDEDTLHAFMDEARISSALYHSNIAAVLDFGLMDGRPFLVTELVDGMDLATALERLGPDAAAPPAIALAIATELAHALDHAHRATDAAGHPLHVVHRDVSPENVLLSWHGEVKLTDFGIAHALERLQRTRAGIAKGKPRFVAPEQLRGGAVDGRADLFALGCVLHRLLVGHSPHDVPALREAIARGGAPNLSTAVPADVRPLLTAALTGDPAARPPDAGDLARALGAALVSRLEVDPRTALRGWLLGLGAAEDAAPRAPAPRARVDLFEVALVATGVGEPLRRFETVATDGTRVTELSPRPPSVARAPSVAVPASDAAPDDAPEATHGGDALVGATLHGLVLERRVAATPSMVLYHARHVALPRRYVVRVLMREAMGTAERGRLEREARALSRLDGEGLVAVADFGTTADGRAFIANELVEGTTLRALIAREGPLPVARAAALARDVAMALTTLADAGLAHRDLSTRHVLVTHAGGRERARVTGFGSLAAEGNADALTRAGDALGSPAFVAPEQLSDARAAGPAADRYALGALVYAMLSGAPPFGEEPLGAIDGHLRRAPAPLTAAGELGAVACALLDKRPAARPALGAVIAAADRALAASAATGVSVRAMTGARVPAVLAGAVVLLALVAAGVAAPWVLGRGAGPSTEAEVEVQASPRTMIDGPRAGANLPRVGATASATSATSATRAAPSDAPSTPPSARASLARRATRPPSPAPPSPAPPPPAVDAARRALADALAARGLRSAAELTALGAGQATRALTDALTRADVAAIDRALPPALAEIAALRIDRALLRRLLDHLDAQVKQRPIPAALAARHVDLLDRATRRDADADSARALALAREILELERALQRSTP